MKARFLAGTAALFLLTEIFLIFAPKVPEASAKITKRNHHNDNYVRDGGRAKAIGTIYGSLVTAIARNPSLKDELFKTALEGYALLETDSFIDLCFPVVSDDGDRPPIVDGHFPPTLPATEVCSKVFPRYFDPPTQDPTLSPTQEPTA